MSARAPVFGSPLVGTGNSVAIMAEQTARPGTTTIVVMGVSGSGKSTVAAELVSRLGWAFAEGDEFHPPENVEKMRAGTPLDDEDRWPWLRRLAEWIGEHEAAGTSVVVTCSALKRAYRDLLRDGHPSVWFAHVTADPELIRSRVEHRQGHYMPPSLLGSQLATLEQLQADEPGAAISGAGEAADVAAHVLTALNSERDLAPPTQEASS
jgi:gluconokinase